MLRGLLGWTSACLASTSLVAACATIAPTTTAAAPPGPYVAAPDEAAVVFYRQSAHGPTARGDDLPLDERWSYVRVFGDDGTPLADLRATEHAVVRAPTGTRRFFVRNWAAPSREACVGAMQAELAPGRVYAVRIQSGRRTSDGACIGLGLVPAARRDLGAFFEEMRAVRSEQRTFLGERREQSPMLDGSRSEASVVEAGRRRLALDAVVLGPDEGVAWTVPVPPR